MKDLKKIDKKIKEVTSNLTDDGQINAVDSKGVLLILHGKVVKK